MIKYSRLRLQHYLGSGTGCEMDCDYLGTSFSCFKHRVIMSTTLVTEFTNAELAPFRRQHASPSAIEPANIKFSESGIDVWNDTLPLRAPNRILSSAFLKDLNVYGSQ